MGVSGCGKTTIGSMLSEKLNVEFFDGDDFHPEENIAKMSSGTPLTDEDRIAWLQKINEKAREKINQNQSAVFACSALKEIHRKLLSKEIEKHVKLIFPEGEKEVIVDRMKKRVHFMPPGLLDSQFSILEKPKNAFYVSIEKKPEEILNEIMENLEKAEFGLVGLGVMGKSLARNLANHGVKLALFNRFVKDKEEQVAEKFIQQYPELDEAQGFEDLGKFTTSLKKPRKIFLMIKAGKETDEFIEKLKPFLEKEDIIIDGGNSHFEDTKRRIEYLATEGIHFIGTGVSGGEEGALKGPSIMPSGDKEAYEHIMPFLNKIAAKDKNGESCCTYIGPEGSGHFIKMVHNGVEYAEMQMIAEVYALLRYQKSLNPIEISEIFKVWNSGDLKSYLLEISAEILTKKENDKWLIDLILDEAGNKGTGNWTTVTATEMGIPATMITAALFARYASTIKSNYSNLTFESTSNAKEISIESVKKAYSLARIVNHQQGFSLIKTASDKFNWNLNLSEIARIWTNGCIIRSTLMEKIVVYFKHKNDLFEIEEIANEIANNKSDLKGFCLEAIEKDIPIPCMLAANDFLNTLKGEFKTANIIQAQRDFFGAHTYQRVDAERGEYFHTKWGEI